MGEKETEMPRITKCNATKCTYNVNNVCRTLAINVGSHAECNTFNAVESGKSGFKEAKGGIGACFASDCKFNSQLQCKAPDVNVTSHSTHADCKTFTPRKQ
jgi:hypothetical protein